MNLPLMTIALAIILSSCGESGKSTNTFLDSDDFYTAEQRVKKLSAEITMFSPATDAEFELINANGFSNQRIDVPGASSWIYQFAIKLAPRDISKWTEGMTLVPIDHFDSTWTFEIIEERKQNWQFKSVPKYYRRPGDKVYMWVFEEEGILFKEVINE